MVLWLKHLTEAVPADLKTPSDVASFELEHALPHIRFSLYEKKEMGEAWTVDLRPDGSYRLTGGSSGLLYAAYELIFRYYSKETVDHSFSSFPRYALRMINCWDNADGSVERGYSGRSLFFGGGRLSYDPARIRELARLLASSGLNVLCMSMYMTLHSCSLKTIFPIFQLLQQSFVLLACG